MFLNDLQYKDNKDISKNDSNNENNYINNIKSNYVHTTHCIDKDTVKSLIICVTKIRLFNRFLPLRTHIRTHLKINKKAK